QVEGGWSSGQEVTRLGRHDGLLSALAVAERVRWQLAGWQGGQDGPGDDDAARAGGITMLRLTPDQLVRDQGQQLGLWGDAVVSDRLARAAIRVQAMLGHGAVTRPVRAGGPGPGPPGALLALRGPPNPAPRPAPPAPPAPP